MRHTRRPRRLLAVALAAVALLTGCTSQKGTGDPDPNAPSPAPCASSPPASSVT